MPPPTKRRRLEPQQVEEVVFDPSARNDYLTGFHKRKETRKQNAREQAIKREKEEKVQQRQQIRKERKEDLEKHVKEVDEVLRKQNPDMSDAASDADMDDKAEGWGGIQDAAPEEAGQEDEYVDEDKYTTVTVEAMGEDGDKDGADTEGADGKKRTWPTTKSAVRKPKVKKPKFRYESKAERQATRQKQKSKNKAAKERREKGD